MTQIGNHDDAYLSTPLEQKLAWFQNAPGLSAVEPASHFMAGAAALYTDSDSQVRATMRSLGADWTGDAATNAGATLQRAADWSQGAGAGHAAGGETVEGYGRSFESLRGQVHWDDPWAWGWNDTVSAAASAATLDPAVFLGNLTTDYFTTAEHNRTNDATAVAALRAHEQQTRAAVESFPALTPAGINPSDADGKTAGGPRSVDGLPAASVAPARAAPITGGSGGDARGAGGVATGLGTAAGGVGRTGGGGAGDPTGGGAGTAAGPTGVGSGAGPIGVGGAATGLVGGPGAASAGGTAGPAAQRGPGSVAPDAEGAGRPGAAAGGTGARGPSAGGPGAGVIGGEGSATRTGPPGRLGGVGSVGGVGGRSSGAAGLGGPDVIPPRGSPSGLSGEGGAGGGGQPSEPGVGLRAGGPPGAGGWRDVVSTGPPEPGAISRGPTSGAEFASRLPGGVPEVAPPTAARGGAASGGMPFLGGVGAGAGGGRSTEHRRAYWVRTSEPFDVPLPPHGDGLLQGSDE